MSMAYMTTKCHGTFMVCLPFEIMLISMKHAATGCHIDGNDLHVDGHAAISTMSLRDISGFVVQL